MDELNKLIPWGSLLVGAIVAITAFLKWGSYIVPTSPRVIIDLQETNIKLQRELNDVYKEFQTYRNDCRKRIEALEKRIDKIEKNNGNDNNGDDNNEY